MGSLRKMRAANTQITRAGVDEQYGIGNGREQRGRHVACQGHTNHQTAESDGGSELEFLEGLHLVSGDHQDNEEQHAHAHAARRP